MWLIPRAALAIDIKTSNDIMSVDSKTYYIYHWSFLYGKNILSHTTWECKYHNRKLGDQGYYVDTCGKNAKKIQKYIDPFTSEPVSKGKG